MALIRKSLALFSLLIGGLTLGLANAGPCAIDPAKSQGTWDGWGTSLCWFANVFGDRDDVADFLFTTNSVRFGDQTLPGLGLNIVRYNAGACSTNAVAGQYMVRSRSIPKWKQMDGFWLNPLSDDPQSNSWDWSVDVKQRMLLQKARERGADKFELFSNSPMWWMCSNHNPSGATKATDDNLPPENYQKFALYMATIARYAEDNWGITFNTVEPFNEPISDYWSANGRQEGCHFSPKAQAEVLKYLRQELDRRRLQAVSISASDESKYEWAVETWRSFDAPTRALVNQVNVHGYQYENGPRDELFRIIAGKRLWNSEYGDPHPDGLDLSRNLHLDFAHLRPTAWSYWQPIDGGNNGGWGLLPADFRRGTIAGQANPKYFVLAHYTRHIRPGMKILTTGETETVAAFDGAKGKLVIIIQNLTETAHEKVYDLSKIGFSANEAIGWLTEPKQSARYQNLGRHKIQDGRLAVTLPPFSIQTFEIEAVAGN